MNPTQLIHGGNPEIRENFPKSAKPRQRDADAWGNALDGDKQRKLRREHGRWIDARGYVYPNTERGLRMKAYVAECKALPLIEREAAPRSQGTSSSKVPETETVTYVRFSDRQCHTRRDGSDFEDLNAL